MSVFIFAQIVFCEDPFDHVCKEPDDITLHLCNGGGFSVDTFKMVKLSELLKQMEELSQRIKNIETRLSAAASVLFK